MTGATSGFGLEAARDLAAAGHDLQIGARRPDALPEPISGRVKAEMLDLDALASVRAFAAAIGDAPIDVLVLNAGIQLNALERSADGFERTFAVNHLAHYLLARLVLDRMAQGGRIIITGSGTHDPEEKTGIPAPRHADAKLLAHPESDPERDQSAGTAGRRAYSSSKLCNIMTARELAVRSAAARPDLSIMAFDPAFVPGTGLARSYGAVGNWIFRNVLPLFIRFGSRVSTPEASGRCLAALVSEPAYSGQRGAYWSVRNRALSLVEPSKLARDDDASKRLWDDSAALVGL